MKKRNNHPSKWGLIALLLVFLWILLSGCQKEMEYDTYDFFLKNDRGTYTYGELVLPKASKDVPLVFMAHGFKGTRNSGGAKELSERLASKGIGAVRIDFNAYTEKSLESPQRNAYTLTDMTNDAVMTINYVVEHFDVDSSRIGLHGRSMGGRVAMILANENKGDFDFKAMSLVAPAGNDSAMVYYMGGQEKWEEMKTVALRDGYCPKQGLNLSYDWFTDFEDYNPAETGSGFGDKPVLVFYNTLDHVVLPETSKTCAAAYANVEVVEVTTEDGHGYEMGFSSSQLKDEIMDKIVNLFEKEL